MSETDSGSPRGEIERTTTEADLGESEDSALPDILPPEWAEEIPPKVRGKVSSFFMRVSSLVDPMASKINSSHIDKALDLAKDNADKNFKYAKAGRWFQFFVFLIAVGIAIFLIVYLVEKDKPEYLSPLLAGFLGFAGGYDIGRKGR